MSFCNLILRRWISNFYVQTDSHVLSTIRVYHMTNISQIFACYFCYFFDIWCIITLYNYGPLCREASRIVNLRGKLFFPRACPRVSNPLRVDKSGCFPTQRGVIVLLYCCQCFIGYLPCGGKLGCSWGKNRVVSRQRKFLPMFYRSSPLWGKIGLFGGEQYTIIACT